MVNRLLAVHPSIKLMTIGLSVADMGLAGCSAIATTALRRAITILPRMGCKILAFLVLPTTQESYTLAVTTAFSTVSNFMAWKWASRCTSWLMKIAFLTSSYMG